jgi:hypothetical protein
MQKPKSLCENRNNVRTLTLLIVYQIISSMLFISDLYNDGAGEAQSVQCLTRPDDQGLIPSRGKGFFLYPVCPDQL